MIFQLAIGSAFAVGQTEAAHPATTHDHAYQHVIVIIGEKP